VVMKMIAKATAILSGALLTAACSSIAPVKIDAGDQCFRCRRIITDDRLAAEIVDGNLALKFKTPGCLAKYLADHPTGTGIVFVTDYATHKFIAPTRALFVPVIIDTRTYERDYRAYMPARNARGAVVDVNETAIGWNDVMRKAKG
jgi:hypothetical protein